MMQPILLLGDPRLYENSSPVSQEDLPNLRRTVEDLHDTLMAFREKYHAGRAIAAPQIGVPKRLIYMYIDRPVVFLNPTLEFPDPERMELLDDCMSFPGLLVRVRRCFRGPFTSSWWGITGWWPDSLYYTESRSLCGN